jgi:hypothetical protein
MQERREGRTPGRVTAALGHEGGIVDRLAMILLEGSFAPGRIGLLESLDKLEDRWLRQRQKELAGAIREALRLKDDLRATQLYEEKRNLGLSLHRRSRPGTTGNG